MSIQPEENNALMNLRDTGLGGMSTLGQKWTSCIAWPMSALPPKVSGDWLLRNPIIGILGCWARAARGQARAEPVTALIKSRRRIALPTAYDHANCCLQQGFVVGKMGFRGQFAEQQAKTAHVRFGSKADIARDQLNVRFTPKNGHWNRPTLSASTRQFRQLSNVRRDPPRLVAHVVGSKIREPAFMARAAQGGDYEILAISVRNLRQFRRRRKERRGPKLSVVCASRYRF